MSKKLRIGLPVDRKKSYFYVKAKNREYWSYRIIPELNTVSLWNTYYKENPKQVVAGVKVIRYVQKVDHKASV